MDFLENAENGFRWFVNTRFGRKLLDILYDTAVLILYISGFALLHYISDVLFTSNAMFFGIIPIGYIIDFGHILALAIFFLEILKEIVKVIKEIIWAKGNV